jgi:serralysin
MSTSHRIASTGIDQLTGPVPHSLGTASLGASPAGYDLDALYRLGYTSYGDKPIIGLSGVIDHINSGYSVGGTSDGIITYNFATSHHITGQYNNPHSGLPDAGNGFTPFSAAQEAAARDAIHLWDDLIPETFVEKHGNGNADITLANSNDPAQGYTFYPYFEKPGQNYPGDVFIHNPSSNWTNGWFGNMGYGDTTLIHELGHSIGLSHPGAYNYDPNLDLTYDNYAEYAQDSTQYSIMSYFDATNTGAQIVNWNTGLYAYAQTPLVDDVLTIQSIYGADPTTRTGNTTYGFHSNAGNNLFDFSKNPYPYLTIYDASGNHDKIDLSGFSTSQFVNLHPGSFSSIGGGMPDAATANAALAQLTALSGQDFGTFDAASTAQGLALYENYNAGSIATDMALVGETPVGGIATSEYENVSIAYGTIIEDATGGSARDLLWGNDVANVLNGGGGDDVLKGFGGNDTLIGGGGNDTFVFANDGSIDTIQDFQTGHDKIDLTEVAGASAAYVHYDTSHQQVQIDTNHDGHADMFINVAGAVGSGDYIFG